jgi:hydrogenase-1 operon protein HyaF
VTPDDHSVLDHALGRGSVTILSRGYGNCRIESTARPHTWRLTYYNSQDSVILSTVEVSDVPEVACAAQQDFADSRARLSEVLDWLGAP